MPYPIERRERVIAATSVFRVSLSLFFDDSLIHQALEIVVKSTGAELVCAVRLTCDFLHDAEPCRSSAANARRMCRVAGERGKPGNVRLQIWIPLYRIPSVYASGILGKKAEGITKRFARSRLGCAHPD